MTPYLVQLQSPEFESIGLKILEVFFRVAQNKSESITKFQLDYFFGYGEKFVFELKTGS